MSYRMDNQLIIAITFMVVQLKSLAILPADNNVDISNLQESLTNN